MYNSQMEQSMNSTSKLLSEDSWMADLDPVLEGGFKVALHQPFPVQIRQTQADGKTIHAHMDILTMRIMVRPNVEQYSQIKLQITSETDIFKTYVCDLDEKRFDRIRKTQSLNFSFAVLLNMLVKQVNLIYKNPQQYSGFLHLNKVTCPKLEIAQNIEYKSIQLLSLDFNLLDQQMNKQYITYRFSYMKAKNERVQAKIKEVCSILKLKNPNLLNSILKKRNLGKMIETMNHSTQKI